MAQQIAKPKRSTLQARFIILGNVLPPIILMTITTVWFAIHDLTRAGEDYSGLTWISPIGYAIIAYILAFAIGAVIALGCALLRKKMNFLLVLTWIMLAFYLWIANTVIADIRHY